MTDLKTEQISENGVGIENTNQELSEDEKIKSNLDSLLENLENLEGQNEKKAKEILEELTGSSNLNQQESDIKNAISEFYNQLIKGYKHTDFVKLDIEPAYNNKLIKNLKVVNTNSLEKNITNLLGIYKPFQDKYISNLRSKYIHTNFDLATKVIENEIKKTEGVINTNKEVEEKSKKLLEEVIEKKVKYHSEFIKFGALQDKCNEEIDEKNNLIEKKKKELDLSYSDKKYERIRPILEKDLIELEREKQDLYDSVNFAVTELRRLSKNIKRNEISQEKIKNLYNNNRNLNRSLVNVYNSLLNAKDEKNIVEDMMNIDKQGNSSKSILKNSIEFCNVLEDYAQKAYEKLGVSDKEIEITMNQFYSRDSNIKNEGIKDNIDLERLNNVGYKIRAEMKKNQFQYQKR